MTATHFEESLRTLRRREPFRPFTIEFTNGNRLLIDEAMAIGFNGGAAGFIGPDGEIHFINCEDVQNILEETHGVPQGTTSK